MKQQIEEIIKKNLPEKKEIHKWDGKEGDLDYKNGYNDYFDDINTSLIADEVLKVVVEKIKERFKEKCIMNIDGDCKYWNRDEENNSHADDKFFPQEMLDYLLSNLSPNKENKNNG